MQDAQNTDTKLKKVSGEAKEELGTSFEYRDKLLYFRDRLNVPADLALQSELLEEAQASKLTMHPGSEKMYHNLKSHFWWSGMRRDIAIYVSKCATCQRVKIEHQRQVGTLHTLPIQSESMVILP